jgi:hypothetical protein
MRIKSDGAYVTEPPTTITGATQANPIVISATASAATAATPVNTGVTATYNGGDTITLGGNGDPATVLSVTSTSLIALSLGAAGTTYIPAQTITLAGGTQTTAPVVTISTTQVVSATVHSGGSGGTNGTQTVTGTTGTGTKFQASVTVSGGAVTAVLAITLGGSYTANPSTLSDEPVTGASLSGAALSVVMGVHTFTISTAGVLTSNPAGNVFTQASTSGSGSGATFQFAVMAPHAVTVSTAGVYGVRPSNPVAL